MKFLSLLFFTSHNVTELTDLILDKKKTNRKIQVEYVFKLNLPKGCDKNNNKVDEDRTNNSLNTKCCFFKETFFFPFHFFSFYGHHLKIHDLFYFQLKFLAAISILYVASQ